MLLDADKRRHEEVGEDTWKLFEAIERSFEVNLGDYFDLAGIRISELAEKIHVLANYPTREKCLSSVAFYRLKLGLREVFNVPERSIRPSTPISEVLPWIKRRQQWKQLEEATSLSLPGLTFSGWLLVVCLVLPFTLLAIAKLFFGFPMGWGTLFFVSMILLLPTIMLCIPFARAFPSGCTTIGDLTRAVLAQNHAAFAARNTGSSLSDVQDSLLLLIALETGLTVDEISLATRIPSDLNIY